MALLEKFQLESLWVEDEPEPLNFCVFNNTASLLLISESIEVKTEWMKAIEDCINIIAEFDLNVRQSRQRTQLNFCPQTNSWTAVEPVVYFSTCCPLNNSPNNQTPQESPKETPKESILINIRKRKSTFSIFGIPFSKRVRLEVDSFEENKNSDKQKSRWRLI